MAHMNDVAANSAHYAAENLKLVQELFEKRAREAREKDQNWREEKQAR